MMVGIGLGWSALPETMISKDLKKITDEVLIKMVNMEDLKLMFDYN